MILIILELSFGTKKHNLFFLHYSEVIYFVVPSLFITFIKFLGSSMLNKSLKDNEQIIHYSVSVFFFFFNMHQNHLEGLQKHRLLCPTHSLWFYSSGWDQKFSLLASSQWNCSCWFRNCTFRPMVLYQC